MLARTPLIAPVYKGQVRWETWCTRRARKRWGGFALLAAADVKAAGPLRWAWDSILLGLTTMVEDTSAAAHAALDMLHSDRHRLGQAPIEREQVVHIGIPYPNVCTRPSL